MIAAPITAPQIPGVKPEGSFIDFISCAPVRRLRPLSLRDQCCWIGNNTCDHVYARNTLHGPHERAVPPLKIQNPLERRNDLRSSSPHLVVGRRRRTAPQLRRKFMDTGAMFGSGIRRPDSEAVGGRLARTPPRRVTRCLAASTIAAPGSGALFNWG